MKTGTFQSDDLFQPYFHYRVVIRSDFYCLARALLELSFELLRNNRHRVTKTK